MTQNKDPMTDDLSAFLEAAWNDHAADPAAVVARLPAARPLLEREPAQWPAFLQFAEHLLLGHLGDADAIEPWLALAAAHPEATPALARPRLAAALLRRAELTTAPGPAALRVRAAGSAASGLATRGETDRARAVLDAAAALACGPDGDDDTHKALAAAYNNFASQLLDAPRDAAADTLMRHAAEQALVSWRAAGTWLHEERALYLLARCTAAVGDAAAAEAHARACLALCAAHEADAFERLYGHEALVHALLARGDRTQASAALSDAHECLAQLPADQQPEARQTLAALQVRIEA